MISPNYSYPGLPAASESRGGVVLSALVLLVLCELARVFGDGLALAGARPDLVLSAVVAIGIFRGSDQGFWLGLLGGFAQDLAASAGSPLGQMALSKLLIGWAAGRLAGSVRRGFVLVPVIVIAVATLSDRMVLSAAACLYGAGEAVPLGSTVAANIVAGIPIYYLVSLLPGGIRS